MGKVQAVSLILAAFAAGLACSRGRDRVRPAGEFVPDTITVFAGPGSPQTVRIHRYAGGPEAVSRPAGPGTPYQFTLEAGGERRYAVGTATP